MSNQEQVVLNMDQNPPAASGGGLSVKPLRSPEPTAVPATPQTAARQQAAAQPRPALTRLPYSKPKSRFVELNHPLPCARPSPISEHCTTHDSEEEEEDDDDEVTEQAIGEKYLASRHRLRRRVRWRILLEWSAFVLLTALLAAALSAPGLQGHHIWGIPLWKWAVMLLVVLCGRLVSGWLVSALAFLIERRYLLEERVLYFVYGLRRSVQNCIWLGLVLLGWTLLINPTVNEESTDHHRHLLRFMSRALIAVLVGAAIWLAKIFLVKLLASSFHVATFFDRMKESVFHHYILEALSGPPLEEEDHGGGSEDEDLLPPPSSSKKKKKGRLVESKSMPARVVGASGRRGLDMERLRRLSRTRATACGVRRLVGHVMKRGLSSSISRAAEELARGGAESEIASEWEARCTAERVFKNVAKPGHKYIEEEDLMRFLTKGEVHTIFPLFEGALETSKIKKSAFRNWVVRAYLERKSLAHSLNDTKTAVQQLHKMASVVVCIIIIVVSLLVMGVATMKVFVVVTSQLLLVGFMFQNTGKTLFESMIFVFVMHPFDVGDRCVIDGIQMIVEEMNILTTVFLRYDNEKIYYPNSVLITKPISNFYRSPDMSEMIEFAIDVSTPLDTITAMKKSIQTYIENKPKHWNTKHSVVVKEIENVNKMKMALNVLHTMNHQNFAEKNNRRSELLLELKRIFESLEIKYHLLPQEVHLTQVVMANGRVPMTVELEGR